MSLRGLALRNPACLLCSVAVCCSVLAMAQNTQTPSIVNSASAGTYRISGVLMNATTGEPVRRASVEALKVDDGHAVASSTTDNDSRFVLEGLAAAKYQLIASKRGFRTGSYDEHDEFSSAIVTGPDQVTTQLEFKLTPAAVVRGVVTNDDGEPVAGARVMLFLRSKPGAAAERTVQADATQTDDTGAYEMANLAAGTYLLAVVAEPWYAVHEGPLARRNAALDVAYPVTYFDSTTEEGSATPIVLAGGTRQEANISLHAMPALHLSMATPQKPDGSMVMPQLQATLFGNPIPTEVEPDVRDPRSGTIEMGGIAPGHYELTQGDPPRIVDLDLSSSQQVDANAGKAADGISGRVRMAGGVPVPEEITLSLQRMDGGAGQSIYATSATHGQFRFEAVPAGQWSIAATLDNKALPVVAVSAGGVQRSGNIVTVREPTPALVVTLSDAETRIEGFARKDGKGIAGAMIVLLPKNPAQWKAQTRRDESDSDGSFALQSVAPGAYTAIAIEDGWALDWTSPDAMARYLPGGTSVTVSEKSGTLVRLTSPLPVQMR